MNTDEEIILAHIMGKNREFVIAHPDLKLSAKQKRAFELALKKLAKGLPLAYILGYRWFYGNKFAVSKNTLIPRPETEQIVELAITRAKRSQPEIIADIGTGTGAIIISLAKNIRSAKKPIKFFGTDISDKALKIAAQNAKAQKAKIQFKRGNLAQPILSLLNNKNILITANLPYLSAKQLKEPTIKHEPRLALYGGKKAHQKIEGLIKQLAKINFARATILLEMNYDQGKTIKKLAEKYLEDFRTIQIH